MAAILRQVRYPLKLKLLTLMIVLIAASLVIFVAIAIRIFREDKSAYIYESLLNKATSEQIILSQKLNSVTADGVFKIEENKLKWNDQDVSEILEKELGQDSAYCLKVIIPVQNKIFEWYKNQLKEVSQEERTALSPLFTKSLYQAVKEVQLNGEKNLYAYDYNPQANFAYVVSLPQDKAFEATSYLINKSAYYGLFILGITMFVSVLLARPLTSQLETLFGMTQEIAQGNFESRVELKGHDEVGALSDSINDMASKIMVFMEEMKEKARLENEVAVAQLVQSSFFPTSLASDSMHGHFEPATECGGDWWGYFDHADWRVLFISDATGHGVPAALLTATMNCCKTSLGYIIESRPDIIQKPHEILRYMNQAVVGAGKEIQVTCFVASYNFKTREFIYSNASHPAPLIFAGAKEVLTKEDFRPLIEANGPRLGQKSGSTFEAVSMRLNVYDTIFLYTDGLTEAENNEKARWGERRLIKSLTQHGPGSPFEIIQGTIQEFKTFTSNEANADDITAVVMKVLV